MGPSGALDVLGRYRVEISAEHGQVARIYCDMRIYACQLMVTESHRIVARVRFLVGVSHLVWKPFSTMGDDRGRRRSSMATDSDRALKTKVM